MLIYTCTKYREYYNIDYKTSRFILDSVQGSKNQNECVKGSVT